MLQWQNELHHFIILNLKWYKSLKRIDSDRNLSRPHAESKRGSAQLSCSCANGGGQFECKRPSYNLVWSSGRTTLLANRRPVTLVQGG